MTEQKSLKEAGYYHLIWSEEEMRKMHSLMKKMDKDEVYFVSMSARSKYLGPEERKTLDLGSAEMFNRKLVKEDSFDQMNRVIHGLQVSEMAYLSRGGTPIPLHCLVVYWCINTKDSRKALKMFMENSIDALFGTSLAKGLDSVLMNCYHQANGKASLIDIDFDVPKEAGLDLLKQCISEMKDKNVEYHVVETKSGYHLLLKRDTLKFNYVEVVNKYDKKAKELFGNKAEVIKNKNEMIPLPGTFQAGFPVKFIQV